MYSPGSGESGLDQRTAAALCYLLSIISGVFFLVTEKRNRFVRFHAWQSILMFIAYSGLYTVLTFGVDILSALPVVGETLRVAGRMSAAVLSFVWGVTTVLMMLQAYREVRYKLPILGEVAERNAYSS